MKKLKKISRKELKDIKGGGMGPMRCFDGGRPDLHQNQSLADCSCGVDKVMDPCGKCLGDDGHPYSPTCN